MAVYVIADGKLHRLTGNGKTIEIKSSVLEGYIEKMRRSVQRNEWKTTGSGARFTGTYDPHADAESRLANIYAWVGGCVRQGDTLYYTQTIDDVSGIYSKKLSSSSGEDDPTALDREPDGTVSAEDGILLSDGNTVYTELDEKDGKIAVAAQFGGESHIGLVTPGSPLFDEVTEGETQDRFPAWSRFEKNVLYYSAAGLALREKRPGGNTEEEPSLSARMRAASENLYRKIGPAALCRLDLSNAEIDELFSDPGYDFIKPSTDAQGNLYFIRKPYRADGNQPASVGGCLLDILLLPVRLIGALFGFLNFFSMAFSGKSLKKNGSSAVKEQDARKMYLDGNLIDAEQELKRNAKKEKNPGIVPASYELCRADADRKITVIKRGVIAYRVCREGILCSNGSSLLLLSENGKENILCSLPRITAVYEDGQGLLPTAGAKRNEETA